MTIDFEGWLDERFGVIAREHASADGEYKLVTRGKMYAFIEVINFLQFCGDTDEVASSDNSDEQKAKE